MSEHHAGESLTAFLLGAAVGAVAGLLLAPCSGSETRRRMRDWMDEEREKVRDFIDREKEALNAKKEQMSSAWEAGKKAYREAGGNAS